MYQADNPQEYEDLGYQQWKKGNMEEALAVFREGVDRFPDHLNLNLCLGFCLLDMDEYVDARKIFENILNHSPGNEDALMGMGKIFLTMSKYEEAEKYFVQILKNNPENETLYLEIARAYYEVNCPEDALGYYKSAISIDAESEEGCFGTGVCYHLLGRPGSAKHYIQKTLKQVGGNFYYEALCYYANILYDEERYDEALKYFEQVPLEKLNDITSLQRMVDMYQSKGRSEEGLASIYAKITSLEKIHSKKNPLYNIKVKSGNAKSEHHLYRCRQKELFDSEEFGCGNCPNKEKRIQQRKIVMHDNLVGYWMCCDLTKDELDKMEFGNSPERGRYINRKENE